MTTAKTKTAKTKPGLIERTHMRIEAINARTEAQIKRRRVAYQNEVNSIRTKAEACKKKVYEEVEKQARDGTRAKPKRA